MPARWCNESSNNFSLVGCLVDIRDVLLVWPLFAMDGVPTKAGVGDQCPQVCDELTVASKMPPVGGCPRVRGQVEEEPRPEVGQVAPQAFCVAFIHLYQVLP